APYCVRSLLQLDLGFFSAFASGIEDAVTEVVVDQSQRNVLERAVQSGDLGEDVDAVDILIDHPRDSTGLAFDALEAVEVAGFVLDVAVGSAVAGLFLGGVSCSAHWGTILSAAFFGRVVTT